MLKFGHGEGFIPFSMVYIQDKPKNLYSAGFG
jgi:hypothetical protein